MDALTGVRAASLIIVLFLFYAWFFDDTPYWFWLLMTGLLAFPALSYFKFTLDREIKEGKRPALPRRPENVMLTRTVSIGGGLVMGAFLVFPLESLRIAAVCVVTLAMIYIWRVKMP